MLAPSMKRAAALGSVAFASLIAQAGGVAEPIGWGPGGGTAPLPRSLTPAEAAFVARKPIVAPPSRAAPATRVRTPSEYEPMEGIMIAWQGWSSVLSEMAREITTTGNAKVFVVVNTSGSIGSASSAIASAGADMSKVEFVVRRTDSVWIRDYGPRYIVQGVREDGTGGVRAIVDHTYNRPRPNDNQLAGWWANWRGEPYYALPLVHGGGNYHLESGSPDGVGHATRLIVNENPALTEAQIVQRWKDYQNLETTLYQPYPGYVDSTQHIDMWMIVVDDNKVLISDWVNEPGSSWAQVSNNAAASFAARGFEVFRTPAFRSAGTHYTYTNAVICNDLVLIPRYTGSQAAPHNAAALAAWQAAMPDKTIRQINCQSLVTYAGVMHCVVMHVPAAPGGDDPTAHVTTLNDPETIDPGEVRLVEWLTDGPRPVVEVDLLLSTDGGQTFPTVIASNLDADLGSFAWVVPDVATDAARLRLVVRDALGHEGYDDTDADLAIAGTACPVDLAEPFGEVDLFDLLAYMDMFVQEAPGADLAEPFGEIDIFDLTAFINGYSAGCP